MQLLSVSISLLMREYSFVPLTQQVSIFILKLFLRFFGAYAIMDKLLDHLLIDPHFISFCGWFSCLIHNKFWVKLLKFCLLGSGRIFPSGFIGLFSHLFRKNGLCQNLMCENFETDLSFTFNLTFHGLLFIYLLEFLYFLRGSSKATFLASSGHGSV
jgi:hypothetical protein